MKCFDVLQLWMDGARGGPENMAIDDDLAQTAKVPILRVYGWSGSWMSLGYFGRCAEIPRGMAFVRRPTGGGIVDHERDWTYSLIIPRGFALAEINAVESYRIIHERLMVFLRRSGVECAFCEEVGDQRGIECFRNPVTYDLINAQEEKIAGAGQRRTKSSLLHQGSVMIDRNITKLSAMTFASELSHEVLEFTGITDAERWQSKAASLYSQNEWNERC